MVQHDEDAPKKIDILLKWPGLLLDDEMATCM